MPVPTYGHFIEPILRYLAAHPEGALARDVHEAAATRSGSRRRTGRLSSRAAPRPCTGTAPGGPTTA